MIRMNSQRGMTLIEVLAYVAVFAITINLLSVAFIDTTRFVRYADKRLETAGQIDELVSTFQQDLRSAAAIVAAAGDYQTGPDTLVLSAPAFGEGCYLIYMLEPRLKRLARMVLEEQDGRLVPLNIKSPRIELEDVRFTYDSQETSRARYVNAEFVPGGWHDPRKTVQPISVVAALRVNGGPR
jgi:prepilin-type N-terminal cleavage/methylation domain-containing protein